MPEESNRKSRVSNLFVYPLKLALMMLSFNPTETNGSRNRDRLDSRKSLPSPVAAMFTR